MIALDSIRAQPDTACQDLVSLLRTRASVDRDRTAFVFLDRGEREAARLTYGELLQAAECTAASLQARGIAGQPVLLVHAAGLEFITAFFGVLLSGNMAVPVAPPRNAGQLEGFAAIARDSRAVAALTQGDLLSRLATLADRAAPWWNLTWIVDQEHTQEARYSEAPAPEADAVAVIQYTSGSTGRPRGVALTHGNILANEDMIARAFGHGRDTRVVGWLPHYHDMGLIGNVLQPVFVGGLCVLMAPQAFVQKPARWLRSISDYRATTSGGPNFAYALAAERAHAEPGLDLACWEVAFVGAEPIRAATLDRFAETFAPSGFRAQASYPCYGLAEASLLATGGRKLTGARVYQDRRGGHLRHFVSCGRPIPPLELAIVDPESSVEQPEGMPGEVWLRGPNVGRGYWRAPDDTAQLFAATLAGGAEGHLRTGDLGFLIDGELYLTGRRKAVIICAGENYQAEDLELSACEGAAELGAAAAFMVDAEDGERLVIACEVQQRARSGLDAEAVAAALRRRIADRHGVRVDAVAFVRPRGLPRTTNGKIKRGACREAFCDGTLAEIARSTAAPTHGEPPAPLAELETWMTAEIASCLGVAPSAVERETPFPALGLDSKDVLAIGQGLAERLGWEPEPTLFWEFPSIAELIGFLSRSAGDAAP